MISNYSFHLSIESVHVQHRPCRTSNLVKWISTPSCTTSSQVANPKLKLQVNNLKPHPSCWTSSPTCRASSAPQAAEPPVPPTEPQAPPKVRTSSPTCRAQVPWPGHHPNSTARWDPSQTTWSRRDHAPAMVGGTITGTGPTLSTVGQARRLRKRVRGGWIGFRKR